MELIDDFMSNSVERRCSAESAFDLAKQSSPDRLTLDLCRLLESPDLKKRAMAAMLLRNLFTDDFLLRLSPNTKPSVTTGLLDRINEEENEDIRRKLCVVVSVVASVYLPDWPEFWPSIDELIFSTELRDNEAAMLLFTALSPEFLVHGIEKLERLFTNMLCEDIDLERTSAVEGLINLINFLSASFPTEAQRLQRILAKVIEMLLLGLKETDNKDRLDESINILDTLVSFDPTSLQANLDVLIRLLFGLLDGGDESTCTSSLLVLVKLSLQFPELDPSLITEKLFPILLERLSDLDSDTADWCHLSPTSWYTDSFEIAQLHKLATVVGAQDDSVAYTIISHYFESFLWQEKFAAFSALHAIVDGCPKLLIGKLEEVMLLLSNNILYDHVWVKCAVLNATRLLCYLMGSLVRQEHQQTLFAILVRAIEDLEKTVQMHGLLALIELVKLCPKDIQAVYLDEIVEILLGRLAEQNETVLPTALEALSWVLACYVSHPQHLCKKVIDSLISLESSVLFNEGISCLSMACINYMFMVNKSDGLKDDASQVINTFKSLHDGYLTENRHKMHDGYLTDNRHQMDMAWLIHLILIGEDVQPHMINVVEYLLQCMWQWTALDLDQIKSDNDGAEKSIDESLLMIIHGSMEKFEAKRLYACKQAVKACEMVGLYSRILGGDFYEWVSRLASYLVPLSHAEEDEVRREAVSAMLELGRSARIFAVEKKQGELSEELKKELDKLYDLLLSVLEALENFGDTELFESMKKAIEVELLEFFKSLAEAE
ncbi:Armadillo-type fold [Arabidopsis thaliana x Arabidopsis arenosa]|uniref:Armadillo-type fold n=1 Tax=Arabidopsis thaliana x Arabidopsis arenosa TaxID=1240361 RepID=A0A8T1ZPA0_9BRAS|nr:Armadillo-type fold [Arabidopsis thaliana x Arabidopsis arenosa]